MRRLSAWRYVLSLMCWMASPTVTIFSASSSGISRSNSSSNAITSSTVSRESAPRSSMNFAVGVTSSSSTPSCSQMISLTRSSTGFAMNQSPPTMVGMSNPWTLHIKTAVDVKHLTGHVGGSFPGQKAYHLGNLPPTPDPSEGNLGQQGLAGLGGHRGGHVRLDEPGGHRVDQDAPAAELARRRLRQADEPGLGGRVIRLAGVPHGPGRGRDVDDPAALLAHHDLRHRPRREERAAEVHVEYPVPVLVLHPDEQRVAGDSGVVHEDVDAAEALLRLIHQPLHVLTPGHVRYHTQNRRAESFQFLRRSLEAGRAEARDHPRGPVLRQTLGH